MSKCFPLFTTAPSRIDAAPDWVKRSPDDSPRNVSGPVPHQELTAVGNLLPKIGITTRRLKQLETISLIREQRDSGHQELAYNARPFVLCGIPLRRPPRDQLAYLRRNGKFFLEIIGHPRFGLPYGQDRLIPIWIATLALQQNSRIVHFRRASQMLEFFHLTKDGRHYRRIVEGFQRVFAATIFFGTDDQPGRNRMTDCTRFHFFERMRLWFADADPASADGRFENAITLSDAFFRECNQHRIPVEREVVAALANAPGLLDFYVWLVWKSWSLRGRTARIPLLGPGGLNEQLGNAPFAGGSVQKPVHPQNDSRVSRYKARSCILSRLRVPARVTRYKSTCLLLRFHVYLATKCAVKFLLVRCLGLPPVFTCINPCKNIPVVGKAFLWKTAAPPPPQCALRWDATLSLVARWVFHHANAARRYCASSSRPSSPELWCRLRARRCCSPAALLLEIGIIEIPVDGTISAGAMIRSHLHRGEERRETARPSFPAVAPSGLCNHSRYRPKAPSPCNLGTGGGRVRLEPG